MLVSIFVLISLILGFILCAGSFSLLKIFLSLLGIFLAVNLVYILWTFSTCLLVRDTEKPIEKANPVCRFATVTDFGLVCSYLGLRIRLEGVDKLPRDSRFLLVSNHRSGFDPVALMYTLRRYELSCIAKPSIMALPVIGRIAYGIGCLGIDRENDRNALKTIINAANYLKKDVCSICIFPEGTRSRTGELLPFHAGSFKIAQRAAAPVAVVAIDGTEKVTKNALRRRTDVSIKVLELIPADKAKAMNSQELADYSRSLIEQSLREVQA